MIWRWMVIDEGSEIKRDLFRGRETRWGLAGWCSSRPLSQLSEADAELALKDLYWTGKCELLPRGLNYYLFDTMVVHGEEVGVRWLYLVLLMDPLSRFCWTTDLRIRLSRAGMKEVIGKLDGLRRRNLKLRSDWNLNGQTMLNRAIRAKLRGLKNVG